MIFAIAQQKGGVGKTTSVANLAAAAAISGLSVLAVDSDPQGSLTLSLGLDPELCAQTLTDALRGRKAPPVIGLDFLPEGHAGSLSLVPANHTLAAMEVELIGEIGRERVLAGVLAPLRAVHDVIFIDTPPTLGVLTVNALAAADSVLVPVTPSLLGTDGLRNLLVTIEKIRAGGINPSLSLSGVFVTFRDGRVRLDREHEEALREELGTRMFRTAVGMRAGLRTATDEGVPSVIHQPKSDAAIDYRALWMEIAMRNDLLPGDRGREAQVA